MTSLHVDPTALPHRSVLTSVFERTISRQPTLTIPQAMATMEAQFMSIARAYGMDRMQQAYWRSIGYRPPIDASSGGTGTSGKGAADKSTGSDRLSGTALAAVITVPTVVVLLLLLLGVVWYTRHTQYRSMFGAVLPPGVSPYTTLLLTDIEDSTVLWERLEMEVMDAVVKIHHSVIRECAAKHRGYESGTEGDAFILAFWSPTDAVRFSMSAQQRLLGSDWPQQLLDQPCCKPAWVSLTPDSLEKAMQVG